MSIAVAVLYALASGAAPSASLHPDPGAEPGARAPQQSPAAQTQDRNPVPTATVADEIEYDLGTVEVSASRPRGSVIGDIEPEIIMDAEQLRAYGATNVIELLTALEPMTRSSRGRGEGQPVVLLNGRRTSGMQEIRSIPFEAIERTEILPEEAALAYGYSADQRVVNIVLKVAFRQGSAQVMARGPSQGGRLTHEVEGNFFSLRNGDRWNFELERQHSTSLFESERDILRLPGSTPYDRIGNITGLTPGAEIDAGLSGLTGSTVTTAAAPTGVVTPTLADFVAGAGQPRTGDLGAYRTLLPRETTTSMTGSVARDLNDVTQGVISFSLEDSQSRSFLGLPELSVVVPGASPWSPFAGDVRLHRYLDGPMLRHNEGLDLNLGLMLDGYMGDWRWTFNGAYQRNESESTTDRGYDVSAWQAAVAAGLANPFADLPVSGLTALRDTSRSVSSTGSLEMVLTGRPWSLPAGEVQTTFKVGADSRALDSESLRSGVAAASDLSRQRGYGTVNLAVPIARRDQETLSALGDLSLNFNAGYESLSDFGGLSTFGFGLNWSPIERLSFIASYTHEQGAPSMSQLNAPLVATPLTPVYDFATGQTVFVTRLTGGNLALESDTREVVKLGVNFQPFQDQDLRFSSNYTWSRTEDEIASFPTLTPALEAALPGRFTRDGSGVLTAIDARPLNYAWAERQDIRTGFNFSRAFGTPTAPQPGARPEGRPGGPGAGGPRGPMAGGPGGPGGPGGFRSGGRGGGQQMQPGQGRFNLSVYHTYRIQDQILIRDGLPLIDQLDGGSTSARGTSRNELQVQAGVFRNGFGAFMNANWREGSSISGGSTGAGLEFGDQTTVNLNMFVDLNARESWVERWPLLKGARISLGVENLFDSRVDVRAAGGGDLPLNYQPDYLDPQGRVIRFNLRKILF